MGHFTHPPFVTLTRCHLLLVPLLKIAPLFLCLCLERLILTNWHLKCEGKRKPPLLICLNQDLCVSSTLIDSVKVRKHTALGHAGPEWTAAKSDGEAGINYLLLDVCNNDWHSVLVKKVWIWSLQWASLIVSTYYFFLTQLCFFLLKL